MNIDKLKRKVEKRRKQDEQRAFKRFCEDKMTRYLERLTGAENSLKCVQDNAPTLESLKEDFNSYNPRLDETPKNVYIKALYK